VHNHPFTTEILSFGLTLSGYNIVMNSESNHSEMDQDSQTSSGEISLKRKKCIFSANFSVTLSCISFWTSNV